MKVGGVSGNLPNVTPIYADEHVLWLNVCVYDLTLGMQVVESLENLNR